MIAPVSSSTRSRLILWLASLCSLILLMVVIGGVTRLTGSGLSIVEWNPIMGALPPLSQEDWWTAFKKYQQYSQYKLMNSGMTLDGFKFIFLWEYIHRLVGRLVGVVFFLPWLALVLTRQVRGRLALRLIFAFLLGGLQGALGWFMVKSGLVDVPQVSHFRLAAHLLLALGTLSYLFWILLDVTASNEGASNKRASPASALRSKMFLFTGLVILQIFYGALVAGLKAGFAYNTFPLMMGRIFPPTSFENASIAFIALNDPAWVQFSHRTLAWLILFSAVALFLRSRKLGVQDSTKKRITALTSLIGIQFVLGVSTLLWIVPIPLAALHQLVGSLVLLCCLWTLHSMEAQKS